MAAHPIVDLGDRRHALGDRSLGVGQPSDRTGPVPGGASGGGEVARILSVDPLDEQRLGTGQRRVGVGLRGRDVERTRQRVTTGKIHRGGRRGLQHPLGVPQVVVHCLGEHCPDPFVGLIAGKLFAARRQHRQLRFALLVKSLAVDEAISTATDFGSYLGADVTVGRLDLLDFFLRRAVPGFQQQVQGFNHRRLADLVGAADHNHAVVRKLDFPVCDAPVVRQDQPMQLHAAPLSASRSKSASAACASTADSASQSRAVATSSSTAAAANPPMPRSLNSPSAGITARSVWLSQVRKSANRRAYLSRQASNAARSVTVNEPVSAKRTTVRSFSLIKSRFMSRSAMSRLVSTWRCKVTNRQRPTSRTVTDTGPRGSLSSISTTRTCPGLDSTSSKLVTSGDPEYQTRPLSPTLVS